MESKSTIPSLDEIKTLLKLKYEEMSKIVKLSNWKPDSSKNGTTVYLKKYDETNTTLVRADRVIKQPIEKLFNLIWFDLEALKQYDQDLEEVSILKIEEEKYVYIYYKIKSQGLISSRDIVYVTTYFEEEKDVYIVATSINYDLPNVKNTVRAELFLAGGVCQWISEKETNYINILHMDFKGWTPKWVVNMAAGSLGKTNEAIEKYLEKFEPVTNLPIINDIKTILSKYK